jgi:hypothetical protein
MIDSKGNDWTSNHDRSVWSSGEMRIQVNPQMTDEQVLASIESCIYGPVAKTDAERIVELEAQLAAILAKLSP